MLEQGWIQVTFGGPTRNRSGSAGSSTKSGPTMNRLLRVLYRWCVASWIVFAACGFPKPADVLECTAASDCKSPGAPFCVAGQCVVACASNDDCVGRPGTPFCQVSSGSCVGCLDSSVCPGDKAICDATEHSCRGCERDDECPGGICVEADGRCVADADVIYVSGTGVNSGSCTRQQPCSLVFGLTEVTADRNHIKILNGTLNVASTLTLSPNLYVEGTDTMITGPAGMFSVAQFVNVTLSHMQIQPASGLVTTVDAARSLRLFDVRLGGGIGVNGGTLEVDRSTLANAGGITCMGGTVTVRRSIFDHSPLGGQTCQLTMQRNRFDLSGDLLKIGIDGGVLTFENNLIIQSEGIADTMAVRNVAPASTVRFNTFVNTTAVPSDGQAFSCSSPMNVTSNIFAYASMHPLVTRDCDLRYALIDSIAVPEQVAGVGSKSADSNTFFVDKAGKDYRLSPSSPARGAAEPGVNVSEDFEGAARPSPAGSPADVGAFEAR
jgi:hypothetical protein